FAVTFVPLSATNVTADRLGADARYFCRAYCNVCYKAEGRRPKLLRLSHMRRHSLRTTPQHLPAQRMSHLARRMQHRTKEHQPISPLTAVLTGFSAP